MLATLLLDLNDELADRVTVDRKRSRRTWAIERILGTPEGSVVLDVAALRSWFAARS